MKKLALALTLPLLIGCGGGGGSSENSHSYYKVENSSNPLVQNMLNSSCELRNNELKKAQKNPFDSNLKLSSLIKTNGYALKKEQLFNYLDNGDIRKKDNIYKYLNKTLHSIKDYTYQNGVLKTKNARYYQYTSAGKVKEIAIDYKADGVNDVVSKYSYNTQGSLKKHQSQLSFAGLRTSYTTYFTYYPSNYLQQRVTKDDSTGNIFSKEKFFYTPNNYLLKIELDSNGDGIANKKSNYYYTNGLLVKYVVTDSISPNNNKTIHYKYYANSSNLKVVLLKDFRSDNSIDVNTTLLINSDGCLTQKITKDYVKGVDSNFTTKYDEHNNKIETTIKTNGNLTQKIIYTWFKP